VARTGASAHSAPVSTPLPTQRRPRILLDGTGLTSTVDGLSIYIVNLLRHIPQGCFNEMAFTLLLNDDVDRADLTMAVAGKPIEIRRLRIAPIGPRRDIQFALFLHRHRHEFDLIHILSSNYPLAMRGGICTVHDVTFRTAFDRTRGIPGGALAARLYLALITRLAVRNADALIAVSDATRREIIRHFDSRGVAPAKTVVIHEGWEHIQSVTASADPFPFEDGGFLLFLGSYRVHKNLAALLAAFALALPKLPRDKTLVISGSSDRWSKRFRSSVNQMNAEQERVVFTGYVSNEAVRRLLEGADALVLPSLSEGFGLPVLEAFSADTPVLCSNTTSLPEVGGDAALYFDPRSPASIAETILRFYSDPELAPALAAAGRRRLNQFSWTRAARETIELYRQTLNGSECAAAE
jgi:glycosyltransferase involved in cell wall biosynthesis